MKWIITRCGMIFPLWIAVLSLFPVFLDAKPLAIPSEPSHLNEELPEIELSLQELRLFVEVMQRIKGSYVDPIDDAVLMQNAIKGMIEGLDAHSAFLSPEEMQQLKETALGKFGGIGVEVDVKKETINVIRTLPETPASRAGLLSGDKITHLNGTAVKRMSPSDITRQMRGIVGSKVKLVVERQGYQTPMHFTIAREIIHVSSVEDRLLERGYGYIRINQFHRNTARELTKSFVSLEKKGPLDGLVLDLRDNPGGVLQAAVDVADIFISKGVIVSTQGRLMGSDLTFTASKKDITHGLPLVVLINGHSASASEIVAGALQDHKRAIIVGSRSYGKGSVQSVLPLFSSYALSGLKLTTARYYTPDGRSIQARGVTPDIRVFLKSGSGASATAEDTQLIKALNVIKSVVLKTAGIPVKVFSEVSIP